MTSAESPAAAPTRQRRMREETRPVRPGPPVVQNAKTKPKEVVEKHHLCMLNENIQREEHNLCASLCSHIMIHTYNIYIDCVYSISIQIDLNIYI